MELSSKTKAEIVKSEMEKTLTKPKGRPIPEGIKKLEDVGIFQDVNGQISVLQHVEDTLLSDSILTNQQLKKAKDTNPQIISTGKDVNSLINQISEANQGKPIAGRDGIEYFTALADAVKLAKQLKYCKVNFASLKIPAQDLPAYQAGINYINEAIVSATKGFKAIVQQDQKSPTHVIELALSNLDTIKSLYSPQLQIQQ